MWQRDVLLSSLYHCDRGQSGDDLDQIRLVGEDFVDVLVCARRLFEVVPAAKGVDDTQRLQPCCFRGEIQFVHRLSAAHQAAGSVGGGCERVRVAEPLYFVGLFLCVTC